MAKRRGISRISWIRGLFLVAILGVIVNLFVIQVIDHQKYVEQARSDHMKRFVIAAKRGQIYMMDGDRAVPVVMNTRVWTVFLDVMEVKNEEGVRNVLKDVLGFEKEALDKAFADKSLRYYVVAKGVSREQAEKIKEKNLRGVGMSEQTVRAYVEPGLAAQTLGFVNQDGVGQYGVEQGFNARLAGKEGYLKTVTDVNNIPLSLGDENIAEPAEDGEDVYLTIDRNVQKAVERILAAGVERADADRASAVVIEAATSKVVAMANVPSFDPDKLAEVKDFGVLSNAVVTDPYEPGSVIKPFFFSAGLETGKFSTETEFDNGNGECVKVRDRWICNFEKMWWGPRTMGFALVHSLNVGMVNGLMKIGGGEITYDACKYLYDFYHDEFKFGQSTGSGVYEMPGILISPDDERGYEAVRCANTTFGQGMTANMMQIATAYASVVNGGMYHKPALESKSVDVDGRRVISEESSAIMRALAIETWQSTNWWDNLREYVEIGGKTGTAEVPDGVGGYKEEETIGTYLGYVGENGGKPKYVIMVRVSGEDKTIRGWDHAGYTFNDIVDYMVQYKNLGAR